MSFTKLALPIVAKRRPDLGPVEAHAIAERLAEAKLLGIDANGGGFIVDAREAEASAIIGVPKHDMQPWKPHGGSQPTAARNRHAAEREKELRARLDQARKAPPARLAPVTQRLADAVAADPALQGNTAEAKTRRAGLRAQFIQEAYAAAGREIPAGLIGDGTGL